MNGISLNARVRVKLTELGMKVVADDWPRIQGTAKAAGGVYETELWELMYVFGKHTYMGFPAVFESVIIDVLDNPVPKDDPPTEPVRKAPVLCCDTGMRSGGQVHDPECRGDSPVVDTKLGEAIRRVASAMGTALENADPVRRATLFGYPVVENPNLETPSFKVRKW